MAASTSARVISADVISADARSTCCISPWATAGTADASPNTPIAPIQIDARIIVSPYLGRLPFPEQLLRRWQMAELIIPHGDRRDHLYDYLFTACRGQELGA